MSFEEFKGWLRGYLELTDGIHEDHSQRILEELDKVEEVEAAPVVPIQIQPATPYGRPLGPWEVDPYRGRWFDYKIGVQPPSRTTVPPAGDGWVWNSENVRRFNEYKPN